jgi:chromate transporter
MVEMPLKHRWEDLKMQLFQIHQQLEILLPSSVLIFVTARWVQKHSELRAVRAFKIGLSPVVISMMIAAGWLLATANTESVRDWPLWVLAAVATLIVWRTKVHMLLLLAIGAALGASGVLTAL